MEPLMISNIVLWCVVCILSLLVFALMRQIGILHERVFPAGALMTQQGLMVGDLTPAISANNLANTSLIIGGPTSDHIETFLLFVAPNCPICKTLLPYAQKTATAEQPDITVYFVSDGNSETEMAAHRKLIEQHHIAPEQYFLSRELGLTYMVEKLPFAVLIDGEGVLRAKGMVNSREHLESLFEARSQGVASLQQYMNNR